MELSDEAIQKLADALVPKVKEAIAPTPTETVVTPKAEASDDGDLVSKIVGVLDQRTKESSDKLYNTLWNDRIKSVASETPGFEEFLNQEDDYGKVRLEQLNALPYDERIQTLDRIQSQYRTAATASTGKTPYVDPKVTKLTEDNEKLYNEVDEKLQKNEYTSINEMQNDFLSAVSTEMDSLMGS